MPTTILLRELAGRCDHGVVLLYKNHRMTDGVGTLHHFVKCRQEDAAHLAHAAQAIVFQSQPDMPEGSDWSKDRTAYTQREL